VAFSLTVVDLALVICGKYAVHPKRGDFYSPAFNDPRFGHALHASAGAKFLMITIVLVAWGLGTVSHKVFRRHWRAVNRSNWQRPRRVRQSCWALAFILGAFTYCSAFIALILPAFLVFGPNAGVFPERAATQWTLPDNIGTAPHPCCWNSAPNTLIHCRCFQLLIGLCHKLACNMLPK